MKKIIYLMLVGMLSVSGYAQTATVEQSLHGYLEKAIAKQAERVVIFKKSMNETEMLVSAIKKRLEFYMKKSVTTQQVINGLYQPNPSYLADEAAYEYHWRKEGPSATKINEGMDVKAFEDYLGYVHRCVYDCVFGNILWKEKETYTDLSFLNVFKQSLSVKYGEMFKEDFTREVSNLNENMQWLVSCPEDQFNDYWEGVFGHKL